MSAAGTRSGIPSTPELRMDRPRRTDDRSTRAFRVDGTARTDDGSSALLDRGASLVRRVAALLFLSPLALLAGCVGGGYPEPPAAGGGADSAYEYVIGEGDTLNIFVWGYPDLSVSVPVRPDGRITTRLVEDLRASGRTPTQLAREIEARYVEYVNKPVVTISVDEFVGSASQRVKVIGAGNEPRTVPYENGMSLLDLVIEVGGLGEFASGNRAVLVRDEGGERRNFSLRLGDLVKKGDMSADIPLRPGDVVIIPESWF